MNDLTHLHLNGELTAGTSGRFADVFNPATGEVQAHRCPMASTQRKLTAAIEQRRCRAACLGRDQPAETPRAL